MCAKIISIANQKGGVGKTTTTVSLGVGLAKKGKRVLLVDSDPQGSLTISMGIAQPDELEYSLAEMIQEIMDAEQPDLSAGILHTGEGVDLIPANITLSGMEARMVSATAREYILAELLETVKEDYDFILIDCMPSLGVLTINAMTAADTLIVPTEASYLSSKGLELLLGSIKKARRLNPRLTIQGILFTKVDFRSRYQKEMIAATRTVYKNKIPVLDMVIPKSVRAEEAPAEGKSIYLYDPKGKVAAAYHSLIDEVI